MPVLAFFAVVGSMLVALLFLADATLENTSPAIITSQRTGLPAPQYGNANAIKTLTTAPAPAPDMTSQTVLAAQPKLVPEAPVKPSAREARAEASPNKLRIKVSAEARREAQLTIDQQRNQFDRFSIKGY
jgi:hypothetical protein